MQNMMKMKVPWGRGTAKIRKLLSYFFLNRLLFCFCVYGKLCQEDEKKFQIHPNQNIIEKD